MDYNATRRQQVYLPRLVGPRLRDIKGVMIHATRGGRSAGDDGPGTENWGNHPDNKGAFWDGLIYESGQQVRGCPDENVLQPLWCSGFGGPGTWIAQDFYFQLELAQGRAEDPFTPEQITSAAMWIAELARIHRFGIRRIPYLSQVGEPPEGICSHEDSANGKRLGKSDPGPMFPWDRFIEYCNFFLDEEPSMPDDELMAARMTNLENYIYGLTGQAAVEFSRKAAGNGISPLAERVFALETNGDSVARKAVEGHVANHPAAGYTPHTHSIGESEPS